jgi:ABC-type branched-subunit amino acid transport system substrate-binding protein
MALLLTFLADAAPAGGSIPPGPIVVGGIYPLSGPYAEYGQSELSGTLGLIDHFNARGGIEGHKLKFIYLNDQLDPTMAVSDAQQLVADGVKAVLAVGGEAEAPADVPLFMRAHIPTIFFNPGDTWGDAKKWPYYYKTGYGIDAGSVALARWAEHLGVTDIGLASDNTGLGVQSSDDFLRAAKADGLRVVKQVYYPTTVVSLSTQMAELRAAGAKGVFITGGGGFNQAFAAMMSIGWSPYIFSYASILVIPKLAGLLGTPLATHAFTLCDAYCLSTPGQALPASYASLVRVVEAKTGVTEDPGVSVIDGNDDLQLLKYAIEKAHSTDGPSLKRVLDDVRNKSFTLPQFRYTFTPTDHNGLTTPQPIISVARGHGPLGSTYLARGSTYSRQR